MAFAFESKPSAKVIAPIGGSSTAAKITIEGTNSEENSADNAAEQINKITGIFGVTVTATGMHQIIDKEAVDNG